MTIFKETVGEEPITISEAKAMLTDIQTERTVEERELRYELARAIEHVNRFAILESTESRELVEALAELEKVTDDTAFKIADLLPQSRDELRAVYAQERYSLDGDELDDILGVVAGYV